MAWETKRIKDLFELNPILRKKGIDAECNVSFVPMECLRCGNIEKRIAKYDDVKSYTPFQNGDLLMAKVTPCFENGNIAIAENLENGIGFGSSEIFVLRSKSIFIKYAFFLSLSNVFHSIGCPSMKGVGGLKRIDPTHLLGSPVRVPSLSEQQRISAYLDKQTSSIDSRIALLEQKKEKYLILRKAVINEAVRPKEGWKEVRLKEIFKTIGSGTTPDTRVDEYYDDNGYNWLQTGDLNDGYILATSKKISKIALEKYTTLKTYPKGSLVIAMYGATIGKIGHLLIETTTNQACCVLADVKNVCDRFIFYWILDHKEYIISLSTGGGQPNINQDIIKFLSVCLPSPVEQQRIASYLDQKTSQIDTIVSKITDQIENLKVLRKCVINESVREK